MNIYPLPPHSTLHPPHFTLHPSHFTLHPSHTTEGAKKKEPPSQFLFLLSFPSRGEGLGVGYRSSLLAPPLFGGGREGAFLNHPKRYRSSDIRNRRGRHLSTKRHPHWDPLRQRANQWGDPSLNLQGRVDVRAQRVLCTQFSSFSLLF